MSQELGVLSIFDGGRSTESPSLPLLLFKWLLLVPRLVVLTLMSISLVLTSVLSYAAVLVAARLPNDRLSWNAKGFGTNWHVGFCSLEEFIYQNWSSVDWGSALKLHITAKHSGRQFPAGPWRIDFLALDSVTNDLVVIHLKRGMTSDSAVGQILRRVSWVKENVASAGQGVRGIILAKATDPALDYAVKDLPFLEVRTYSVDFHLSLSPARASTAAKSAEPAETSDRPSSGDASQTLSKTLAS